MTALPAASRWPEGVGLGAVVIACTSSGFWLRARVVKLGPSEARVRFDAHGDWPPSWLPSIGGFGEREASVTPERVAALPDAPPAKLPRVGAPVLVLWDRKRFHPAILLRRADERTGVVRHDEGDEEPVTAERVLLRGELDDGALARAAGVGLAEGASVQTPRGQGWVSMVGSGAVYVRFPKASHGLWFPLTEARPGGSERPPSAPSPLGELAPGARVSARWVDRVWYPATVRALRGAEVELAWDDGATEWVAATRAVVTTPAKPAVPQEKATRPRGPEHWGRECSVAVLARDANGDWGRGRAIAARGGDAFVRIDRGGAKFWARGGSLATPVDPLRFPAKKAAVVVEAPAGASTKRFEYRTGRAVGAKGDRLEIRLDEGGTTTAPASVLFARLPVPPPSPVPDGVALGASVLVEDRPGVEIPGRIVQLRAPDGVARVETTQGKKQTRSVDLARVRLAPVERVAKRGPEPVVPPPAPPALAHEPTDDERASELLRRVAERWSDGASAYREASGDASERTRSLEVDVGELTLEVRAEPKGLVIEITAAGRVEDAPPADAVSVRLAHWLHARIVGGARDPGEIEREDLAWSETLVPTGVARRLTRAGGALCLTVRCREAPAPGEVVRWARAVHDRLFGGEG